MVGNRPGDGVSHLLVFYAGDRRRKGHCENRLFGLVATASASRAEDPGFECRLRRDFSGVESYK